jgi:folylpolyglutamate synthase
MPKLEARGYDAALANLNLLASNRAITSLFDKPSKSATKPDAANLNAQAIPEVIEWLRRAGYKPQDLTCMQHIHVAGTKGKGSVCAFATAMLREYGTVGTYTSPHLVSPRERIAIDGEPVSQELFTKYFFELWDRFTQAAVQDGTDPALAEGPSSKPFYFRFLTILAWHIFIQQGIPNVVMEVGIGGEYDATNIMPPEAVSAAVVSQLGIDHVAMLGDTIEQITWHKAGIFKPGAKAFTLRLHDEPGVMKVLRQRAAEKGTTLEELDEKDVEAWPGVESSLMGSFQKRNQALAVMAVREHLQFGNKAGSPLQDIPAKMVNGLRKAKLRGRCEVIRQAGVEWMLDGAHTKESVEQVAMWLAQSVQPDEKVVLVFNQQERNAAQLLSQFLDGIQNAGRDVSVFSHALFTRNDQHPPLEGEEKRDMSVQKSTASMMKALAPECHVSTYDNLETAVELARSLVTGHGKTGRVLATGSLHLVGGILRALEPDSLL